MKLLIASVFCVLFASSMTVSDSIGQSCQNKPNFNVTSFTVNPWPIVLNQNYTFTMTGFFTHKELLDQLTVGVQKGLSWTYTYFTLNQNYADKANATFSYQMPGPTSKASYTNQITLHRPDYTTFACWQFSYTVNN